MRRATGAPIILLGVWLMTMLVSLPLTLVLRDMIRQHLGSSLAGERAAGGIDSDWMQEFGDQAAGIGITFKPTIIGFAAVLDNSSAFLDNTTRPLVVVGAASGYIGLWIFLAGGILDRYARERPTRAHGFFSACGGFFFRFLRLAAVDVVDDVHHLQHDARPLLVRTVARRDQEQVARGEIGGDLVGDRHRERARQVIDRVGADVLEPAHLLVGFGIELVEAQEAKIAELRKSVKYNAGTKLGDLSDSHFRSVITMRSGQSGTPEGTGQRSGVATEVFVNTMSTVYNVGKVRPFFQVAPGRLDRTLVLQEGQVIALVADLCLIFCHRLKFPADLPANREPVRRGL